MTMTVGRSADAVLPALTDADRLTEIEDTGLLAGADPTMDRLARLAAALVGAPRAFVTLVTPDGQHLPGMVRHDDPDDTARETPLSDSLCQFAVATEEPLVVPDGRADPLVRDTEPVRSGDIGAYAGLPLRTAAGHVLGTLCVVDSDARSWDEDRLALLQDLTELAADEVNQRLTQAREQRLRHLVQDITRQIPPLADAMHCLVDLAERQEEPGLQRYASLTRSRLEPVVSLGRRLEAAASAGTAAATTRGRASIDLGSALESCARSARAATGSSAIRLELPDMTLPVRCDGVGLQRSITHVVVTALHHSRGDAPVVLRLNGPTSGARHAADDDRHTATLQVLAEDCPVPTGELARLVARFHEATCEEAAPQRQEAPASVQMSNGTVTVESGSVSGQASRDGRLILLVRWRLDTGPDGVKPRGPRRR